jgi:hypothetical protein
MPEKHFAFEHRTFEPRIFKREVAGLRIIDQFSGRRQQKDSQKPAHVNIESSGDLVLWGFFYVHLKVYIVSKLRFRIKVF